ncbi:hypothetical protein PRIC1_014424 [Phytophthora ramorum]|nr:Fructokinase [Phytophthora ramorum]
MNHCVFSLLVVADVRHAPKPNWGHTDVVSVFNPAVLIDLDTDASTLVLVLALALYVVACGGHGEISSAVYITVGTGVGVCTNGNPIHSFMHSTPSCRLDIETGFKGLCPFHGNCIVGMAASGSISAPTSVDRRDLATFADDDPVWDTIAHYLANLCPQSRTRLWL